MLDGFDENAARQLSEYAKLKNILAHEYLDVHFKQLEKFARESKTTYQYLIDFTKGLINRS